jgi:hypothetical protein
VLGEGGRQLERRARDVLEDDPLGSHDLDEHTGFGSLAPSGPCMTKRQAPPGLGSNSWNVFVKPFGPHQCTRWAGRTTP